MRDSNEPCAARITGGLREPALRRPHDRLGAYGECRDSEQPLAANLSAWIIVRATGEIIMNNYLYDRGFKILLPHWETIRKESKTDDECHKRECPDKGSKIISIDGTSCTDTAGDGRCALNTPFINTAATGQNINRLRAAAGLTVRDMQMIFGFTTPQAIYKWIHGTALPTIDNLVILADVLDVTMNEIIVVSRTAEKSG